MGTPILAGRDFNASDSLNSQKAAIVSEQFAAKFFGGGSPVGRTFQIEQGVGVERPLYQIVGLVKDAKYTNLREEFTPIAFLAAAQEKELDPSLQIVVRSSAPLATLTTGVTGAVAGAAPSAIIQFQTLNSMVRDSLMRERLMATLSGFFGLLAGLLATIGLYGVMSYMVERRRNEIGIRIALGADRGSVIGMIMREAGGLLGVGLIVGGLAAVGRGEDGPDAVVRTEARRSDDAGDGRGGVDPGRGCGELRAGVACLAARADAGAARGVAVSNRRGVRLEAD